MFDDLTVLFVEDDPDVRVGSQQALELAGLRVRTFDSAEAVCGVITRDMPAVLVSDIRLPGMDGQQLMKLVLAIDPQLPVILITGHGDISMAVDAMRNGAYDFLEKPFASETLTEVVQRALEKRSLNIEVAALRRKLAGRDGIEARILGRSSAISRVRETIMSLADTDADILVCGETGTGKELVARCLHDFGRRGKANFVAINCSGMPETLFESEVFGHEAGAFTGALKRRIGKVEHARGGTLMLDEVETMPLSLQAKLLRTLQEREFERLGSNQLIPMECRVIACTKADLRELSTAQRFRGDLYYRLSVVQLEIPSLRERREDIPELFEHFALQAATRYARELPQVSAAQMHNLVAYSWPGNVRELHNIANQFVLGLLSDKLDPLHLARAGSRTLPEQLDCFERYLIEEALKRHDGRVAAVSDDLGVPRKTLYAKIKRLGLSAADFGEEVSSNASSAD